MKNSQKAFTLIELLIVIAIIAILTAIITANFTKARANSRDAKRLTDIAFIQEELELFFDRCNGYPPTLTTTATISTCPPGQGITLGTFLSQIPNPPTTVSGDSYTYAVNGVTPATDYVLRAKLEAATNPAYNDDVDGSSVYSLNCDDSGNYYCVQPR